jgi:serine/threonine protein phosphatase PrpC
MKNLETFGVSVIGPLHQQENRPNEDAWGKISGSFGTGIVVSDGMGSKPNARHGAKMVIPAVKEALRYWVKAPSADPVLLLRLIHLHWELKVLPFSTKDSAATCLLAVVTPKNELIMAQLGDGIAVLKENNQEITILNHNKNFGNQTTALGVAKSTKEWSIMIKPHFSVDSVVLLATDGIADDLISDKIGEFIKVILDDFGNLSPHKRGYLLANELKNWATPNHLDDKTLAILWHRPHN